MIALAEENRLEAISNAGFNMNYKTMHISCGFSSNIYHCLDVIKAHNVVINTVKSTEKTSYV